MLRFASRHMKISMPTFSPPIPQKIPDMRDQCYAGLLLVGDNIYLGEESGIIVLLEPGATYTKNAHRFPVCARNRIGRL